MQAQMRRDTKPELMLRKRLFSLGMRYRGNFKVPSCPRRTTDIAFPRIKVAVFVDGCFWHGCPEHCVLPKNSSGWWKAKPEGNKRRDEQTAQLLEGQGWRVVRLWEHESVEHMAQHVSDVCQHQGRNDF